MKSSSGFTICIAVIVISMTVSEVFAFPIILKTDDGSIQEFRRDHKCRQCIGEECHISPEPCPYGTYRDRCGRVNCYQGPGNFCIPESTGVFRCAKNLSCRCNKCLGCLKNQDNGEYYCMASSCEDNSK